MPRLPAPLPLLPWVAAGGALGAGARWSLGEVLPVDPLAWGTLTANLTGCALLGALLTWLLARAPDAQRLRAFAGVGVLGGFTTFSTAMLDAHTLVRDGSPALAGAEIALGLLGGLLAVLAGMAIARRVLDRRSGEATP